MREGMGGARETNRASGSRDTRRLRRGRHVREAKSNRDTRRALSQKPREQAAARETAWRRRKGHTTGTTRARSNLARSCSAKVETWRKEKAPESEGQANLSSVWGERKQQASQQLKGMNQPKDNKMDVFIHCQHNVLHNCYMTWSSVLLLHIFNLHQDQKKREKRGLQTWQSGHWEMSWLGDHVAINNWRAWCEEKEHWESWVSGRRSEDEEHESDTSEGMPAKISWNAGASFRKGYLPAACFRSNEKKTAEKV